MKIILLFIVLYSAAVIAQNNSIDYFGQTLPGDSAIIFAPGIISLPDRLEGKVAFSPDGKEFYFTVWGSRFSSCKVYYTKCVNNKWTEQIEVPFSSGHYCGEPFVSADGSRIYFDYSSKDKPTNIWMAQCSPQGWSEPQELPAPFNSEFRDANYSESIKGTVYLTSNRANGLDERGDIWCVRKISDKNLKAENLGVTINSTNWDAGGYIAPDESFIIFTSERSGGHGYTDLYISFQKEDGSWTESINMERNGSGININDKYTGETDPVLSPDGRFLFFTRHSMTANGEKSDVYWISTKTIDDIRKEIFDHNQTLKSVEN